MADIKKVGANISSNVGNVGDSDVPANSNGRVAPSAPSRGDSFSSSSNGLRQIVKNGNQPTRLGGSLFATRPSYDTRAIAFLGNISRSDLAARDRGADVTAMERLLAS